MHVSGAPPTARTAFRLRMLLLDDTRTLKYNTLISVRTAHILQKYNTYATYPRAFHGSLPPGRRPRRGPVPKSLWADLLTRSLATTEIARDV